MNWIKTYWKDLLIVLAVIATLYFAVNFSWYSSIANKPFWWKFWGVFGVVCIAVLVGIWLYFSSRNKKK